MHRDSEHLLTRMVELILAHHLAVQLVLAREAALDLNARKVAPLEPLHLDLQMHGILWRKVVQFCILSGSIGPKDAVRAQVVL